MMRSCLGTVETASTASGRPREGTRVRPVDGIYTVSTAAFETAHGEANEAMGWLKIAEACGYALDDAQVRRTLDRLLGLLWGLCHR